MTMAECRCTLLVFVPGLQLFGAEMSCSCATVVLYSAHSACPRRVDTCEKETGFDLTVEEVDWGDGEAALEGWEGWVGAEQAAGA